MSSIYFLAADDSEALRFAGEVADLIEADRVFAHDMITVPHLTALPDLAEGLPVAIDLSVTAHRWPHMPEDPESDISWMAEPIVERIADALRDRIAAIDPAGVESFVEAWGAEVSGSVDDDAWPQLAADLIALARRGRDRHLALHNRYEM